MEDRVELPRLYIGWHSPAMFAADDAELDIVGDVLAHGKTSRLYKTLVYERRVATDVSAYQHLARNGRHVSAGVHGRGGCRAAGVERRRSSARSLELASGGPTAAEIERGIAQTEAQFIYRLQTIGGFGGKGDQLNAYNTFVGNPGYFDADRQRYFDVTSRGAAAAVSRWLVNAPSVSLSVVPKGRRDLALPDATEVQRIVTVDRSRLPIPGPDRPFHFPRIVRRSLANGLELRAVRHRSVPIVSMVLLVPGGSSVDPDDGHGLVSMTAGLLDEGSRGQSALEIADRIARIGGDLDIEVGHGCRRRRPDDARSVLRDRPGAGARDRDGAEPRATTTSTASATCGSSG